MAANKQDGAAAKKAAPARRKRAGGKPRRAAPAIRKKFTKAEILSEVSRNTGLTRGEVVQVLDELSVIIERHVKKRGVGEFTLPGLLKIKSVRRPARPARKGVPNPFRPGELMDIPRKPATQRVKIQPLQKLKEFALR